MIIADRDGCASSLVHIAHLIFRGNFMLKHTPEHKIIQKKSLLSQAVVDIVESIRSFLG
jgi:hypothetical protein